jgi:hypothetical protein
MTVEQDLIAECISELRPQSVAQVATTLTVIVGNREDARNRGQPQVDSRSESALLRKSETST